MSSLFAKQETLFDVLPRGFAKAAGPLLETSWPYLLAILGLCVLGRLLRTSKVKGRMGEAVVSVGALKQLDPKIYRVFNNLVLPRPDGRGTTQIDHVVVSVFGIFVIETKHYAGWIFGDETSRYWTQILYGKKSRFQNPLHQNALHLRALAKESGLPATAFHNLVFFSGDATLKTPLPPQVMTRGIIAFILGHQTILLTADEVEQVVSWCEEVKALRRPHTLRMRASGQRV